MTHFIISYPGNKRKEYKYFKDNINLDGIKNIIEPFCGTSAISFNLWLEHGDKYNYYLNDNSSIIYNLYQLIRNEEPNEVLTKLNNIKQNIKGKEDHLKLYNSNYDIYEYIVLTKISYKRLGLFNKDALRKNDFKFNNLQLQFFEFIKSPNVFISNEDWHITFDKFKDDNESLIFLDPPYLSLYNDFYQDKKINIYEYLFNNRIENFKSYIFLILEDMWIIKLLFKDNNIISKYNKQYGFSGKKTEHILIYNKFN